MAVFPSTPIPRYGSNRGKKLNSIRTESEAGYGQTRRQFTKHRVMYELSYDNITNAEYNILEAFFLANQGTIFTFTHPKEASAVDVMFAHDEITANDTDIGRCTTKISLIGV